MQNDVSRAIEDQFIRDSPWLETQVGQYKASQNRSQFTCLLGKSHEGSDIIMED
jgi:hypothetical protein